jgi:hypothetical protein
MTGGSVMINKTLLIAFICMLTATNALAETFTIVLLDLSGSVKMSNASGKKGSPLEKNMLLLKAQIEKLNKSDKLMVLGFGRKTDVVLLKVTAPSSAGAMNKNLVATREAALQKLQENFSSRTGTIDGSRTDVVGACFRASRVIDEARSGNAPVRLVILSDMLDTENLGLSLVSLKQGIHKEFLKKAEKMGYPDLKAVEMEIFSAFSDIPDTSTLQTEVAIKELKELWSEYFRRSGGVVKSYKTSY